MELIPFTFIFATIVFWVMIALKIRQRPPKLTDKNSSQKMPPGPWRLPVIGNMHQLLIGNSLPHHLLRDLANKHGPLMHLELGEVPTIVVSSSNVAQEVFKTNDIIFSHRAYALSTKIMSYDYCDILFAPYGNYWRQMRKICTTELLSAKRVQSGQSIREEEVSNFVKTLYSNVGSMVNLSEKIFDLNYCMTARVAFGKKCKDQEALKSNIMEFTKLASGLSFADFYPSIEVFQVITGMRSKYEKLHRESDRILDDILNDHRQKKKKVDQGEDLVDVLLKLQQDSAKLEVPLTENNIKAVIWDIFAAASDTSATVVEWAMAEMLKNPSIMKEAQAEVRKVFNGRGNVDETGINKLKFLKSVVKETLRLHPPAPLSAPRENSESCKINGYEIPIKSRVIVNIWAIGRDPRYWNDAEKFYPERFLESSIDYKGENFEYIPFGAGRRMCPGISFAQPSIELQLAQLLYHFDWRLYNGMKQEDLDMTENFGLTTRRKNDLLLVPVAFHPFSSIE